MWNDHCSHVAHGESLAVFYPEFTRYTYKSAEEKFAKVGRIFNPELEKVSNAVAAEKCCEEIDKFLKEIGMWISFKGLKVPEEEIRLIANDCKVLPDYKK